jgi:tellurite resistance protein TerC
VFIGTKMLVVDWIKIPVFISLAVVAALIGAAMLLSLWIPPRPKSA